MARSRGKSIASKNGTHAAVVSEEPKQSSSSSLAPQHLIGDVSVRQPDIRTLIQLRAYQLFEQRGRRHGHDVRDWLDAEQLTLAEQATER